MYLSNGHFARATKVKFREKTDRTQIERSIQDWDETQERFPNFRPRARGQIPPSIQLNKSLLYIWSDYSTTFAKKTLNQTITHIRASHFQKAANHLMMAMMMLLMMAMMVTMMVTMLVTMMVTMMTDGWVANSWAAKNQGRTKAPHSAPANNLQRSNCETSLFFFDSIAYKYFSLLFKF